MLDQNNQDVKYQLQYFIYDAMIMIDMHTFYEFAHISCVFDI